MPSAPVDEEEEKKKPSYILFPFVGYMPNGPGGRSGAREGLRRKLEPLLVTDDAVVARNPSKALFDAWARSKTGSAVGFPPLDRWLSLSDGVG